MSSISTLALANRFQLGMDVELAEKVVDVYEDEVSIDRFFDIQNIPPRSY
jgi:hypothetical protein